MLPNSIPDYCSNLATCALFFLSAISPLFKMHSYNELIDMSEKLMIDEPVDVKARYFPAFAYNATGQYVSPTRILSGTELRQAVNDG